MQENNQQPDKSVPVYSGQLTPMTPLTQYNPHESPMAASQKPVMPYQEADGTKLFSLLAISAAAAVLYAICFSGERTLPQLSFAIFCPIIFTLLVNTLKSLGYLRNRQALFFAVPIITLALMNGIFSVNMYTYGNVILMHILFAAFIMSAMSDKGIDLFNVNGMLKITMTIIGSWSAVFQIITSILAGKRECDDSQQKRRQVSNIGKIVLGLLCAAPLLLIIGGLLVSADRVFAEIVETLMTNMIRSIENIDMLFIITVFTMFIYCTGYIWRAKNVTAKPTTVFSPIPADVYICASFLAALNILFLFFSVIQTAFLFSGGLLKLPGDMVYSEYVREGFFQLLAVTIINFAVIYILLTVFSGASEKPVLRVMIFLLLGFTVVLIASSFYRMIMYVGVYAFTPMRLSVITFLVMELVLVWFTAIRILKPKTPFVKRFIITCIVFYIIANVSASGYVSAKLNVAMFQSGGTMRWIDATSSGADGFTVIKPFLESDDYICRGNLIIRRNEPNVPFFFEGDVKTAKNIEEMLLHKTDIWQNWSLVEILGRR